MLRQFILTILCLFTARRANSESTRCADQPTKQWASKVVSFSHQYSPTGWSADQILGEPTVYPRHGAYEGAWPMSAKRGAAFIEIEFEMSVRVSSVHIYETCNPGAIVKVKGRESSGLWTLLWECSSMRLEGSRIFTPELSVNASTTKMNQIRLELELGDKDGAWCELDAVQIVGFQEDTVPSFMEKLIDDEMYSDVMLLVDGQTIHGHKAILGTRSPYFARIFETKQDEVGFEVAVYPDSVFIYETLHPGSVVKVKGRESHGPWITMWETDHPSKLTGSRRFAPEISNATKKILVDQIRLELNMSAAQYYSELDAVEMVGTPSITDAPINTTQMTFRFDVSTVSSLTFDGFKTAFHFLYTDRLPINISFSELQTMCHVASIFEVPDLKAAAIGRMMDVVRVDNVVSVFMQSNEHRNTHHPDVYRAMLTYSNKTP